MNKMKLSIPLEAVVFDGVYKIIWIFLHKMNYIEPKNISKVK